MLLNITLRDCVAGILVSMAGLAACAGEIDVGDPGAAGGTITFDITDDPANPHTVVIPASTAAPAVRQADKVTAIIKALQGYTPFTSKNKNGTTKIKIDGVHFTLISDTTTESIKMAYGTPPNPCSECAFFASIGFKGNVATTGKDGLDSIFEASFGDNDTPFASASVNATLSTGLTMDDVVSELYAQLLAELSPPLQASLVLDLTEDTIGFAFAPGAINPFVASNTTSEGALQTLALRLVPEPSPLVLLAISFAGLMLTSRRG